MHSILHRVICPFADLAENQSLFFGSTSTCASTLFSRTHSVENSRQIAEQVNEEPPKKAKISIKMEKFQKLAVFKRPDRGNRSSYPKKRFLKLIFKRFLILKNFWKIKNQCEKLWKIKPKSGEFANFTGRVFVKKQFFFKGSKNPQGVQLSGIRPRQRIRDVRPVVFENVKKVDWGCGWAVKLRQSRVKKGDFGGFFHIFAFFHD